MSNPTNVKDLLKKKVEKEKEKAADPAVAVEVDGDIPERAPRIADLVVLTWGDPQLVGGPLIDIPFIITLADPKTGRVNGQMITDPTMQGMDPRTGRAIPLPGIAPVANIPYSATPKALTWRYRED